MSAFLGESAAARVRGDGVERASRLGAGRGRGDGGAEASEGRGGRGRGRTHRAEAAAADFLAAISRAPHRARAIRLESAPARLSE